MTDRPSLREYSQRVYLKPAELYIAASPTVIETVLGSCVAVTLYCRARQIGAVCHATLPTGTGGDFRYVNVCLAHMITSLKQAGANPATLVAKIFGGADVLSSSVIQPSVGLQNTEVALTVLAQEGIHIVNQDVGGRQGRKLIFLSDTGRAFVKKLAAGE
nr:chemotaxis protein CheD [uncultured Desulfuromonas sp.]